MPEMNTKTNTATMFAIRLKSAARATESGITSRGKRILRSRFSRSTSDVTPRLVASAKKLNSTIDVSR